MVRALAVGGKYSLKTLPIRDDQLFDLIGILFSSILLGLRTAF